LALYDEHQKCTEAIEVILKRIKSIDFFSQIGCAAKSMEYMGKTKYNEIQVDQSRQLIFDNFLRYVQHT
jgi:hypothetical protein